MTIGSIASNCGLLVACANEQVCVPKNSSGQLCPDLHGTKKEDVRGGEDAGQRDLTSPALEPIMFPPLQSLSQRPASSTGRTTEKGIDASAQRRTTPHAASDAKCSLGSSPSSSSRCKEMDCVDKWIYEASGMLQRGHQALSHRSWRKECKQLRTKLHEGRQVVQDVAEWGPQVGHRVDLHTGKHLPVTFWLREDIRALCLFDREDTHVRMYLCGQMESCDEVERCPEVRARQFFLNLADEGLSQCLLVTMEQAAHGVRVMHQGHVGTLRTQVLLRCKDHAQRKELLRALRVLNAELLVHEQSDKVHTPFLQLSESERFLLPSAGSNLLCKEPATPSEADVWSDGCKSP